MGLLLQRDGLRNRKMGGHLLDILLLRLHVVLSEKLEKQELGLVAARDLWLTLSLILLKLQELSQRVLLHHVVTV